MKPTKTRVLVVSGADNTFAYFKKILPYESFDPILKANNSSEAKRFLLTNTVDILIIDAPLTDEFGIDLAQEYSQTSLGILIMVNSSLYEQVAYRVEDLGIYTIIKPNSTENMYSAVKLLSAMHKKLAKMETKTKKLQEKMQDIKIINQAKIILIQKLNMSEESAHYYIEKQAMDIRLPKSKVAENIIRTYNN
ncbi:MAG: ANTAR domain-containing response regulator [Candidatus Gastranaerophilaceae bacterium]